MLKGGTVIDCPNIAGAKAPVAPALNTPLPLDEGIAKICKKLSPHDGILSYLQDSTANPAFKQHFFALSKSAFKKTS